MNECNVPNAKLQRGVALVLTIFPRCDCSVLALALKVSFRSFGFTFDFDLLLAQLGFSYSLLLASKDFSLF